MVKIMSALVGYTGIPALLAGWATIHNGVKRGQAAVPQASNEQRKWGFMRGKWMSARRARAGNTAEAAPQRKRSVAPAEDEMVPTDGGDATHSGHVPGL